MFLPFCNINMSFIWHKLKSFVRRAMCKSSRSKGRPMTRALVQASSASEHMWFGLHRRPVFGIGCKLLAVFAEIMAFGWFEVRVSCVWHNSESVNFTITKTGQSGKGYAMKLLLIQVMVYMANDLCSFRIQLACQVILKWWWWPFVQLLLQFMLLLLCCLVSHSTCASVRDMAGPDSGMLFVMFYSCNTLVISERSLGMKTLTNNIPASSLRRWYFCHLLHRIAFHHLLHQPFSSAKGGHLMGFT